MTGSTTSSGISRACTAATTASTIAAFGEHAGLGRVDTDVGDDGLDLRRDEIGRQRRRLRDAERVLRGDRRDGGRAVDVVSGERLEVGLNAGPGARIASGDGQGSCALAQRAVGRGQSG